MVETRRLKELTRRARELLVLPPGDLVLALSGGADSATLALLVAGLGPPVRAIHINHGLPASARLEESARAIAGTIGLQLDILEIDIPPGASIEGRAREARYKALIGALQPAETLLTAHTLDDQAETVIMNLIRGAGPTGLAGIPTRSGSLARPMLRVSRSDTRELAALAGLPYFDDPSNLDRGLRRNAVRLEVIPELAARFNPRLVEALARSAALAHADDAFLQEVAASVPVVGNGALLGVPLGSLLAVARPVADRVLRRCLSRIRPPYGGSASELEVVWAVARRAHKSATLEGGVVVAHDGPLLTFRSVEHVPTTPARVDLEVGANEVGSFEIFVERVDGRCRVAPIGLWSAVFPVDVALEARLEDSGRLVVVADAESAWVPGERRLPVAWYQPGSNGYLSVFATEGIGWTSSP